MKDLASEIKTLNAIKTQVASGESVAINGYQIDKLGFESAIFAVQLGDTTGTPTTFGAVFKVQESSGETAAAIATNWADVSGASITFSGESVANQGRLSGEINVDLKPLGRYVRAVAKPNFNGGSSPKVNLGAIVVLGEAKVTPV
jgi:hypothetical protein